MGPLPRPDVPAGAVRTLFTRLHELHHEAGWPSLREMAKQIGCSHTTISAAFSRPVVPRWGLLELIVEELHGDTDSFHRLWLDATKDGRTTAGPGPSPPAPTVDVPRQLPADVSAFTGRSVQLGQLDELARTARVAVISGMAGVGKTALAVHWAHHAATRYPDGHLYLNLRGYDPGTPISPPAALESMLRALGVNGAAIPQNQADRAARYRTVLAGKKALVVLDNASSVAQVRDLLPGDAACFALVTSRDKLGGLVARHGAVRLDLDLLSADEAQALLRSLIGRRIDDEPGAARLFADRCARLPLALRIAAELAAARPADTLQQLNRELDAEPRTLDVLTTGDDEYSAVRSVFSWSWRQLGSPAAALFALLGGYPGGDIDRQAAAALAGTTAAAAARVLDELARVHLIDQQAFGRFGVHDLLRGYAVELCGELDDRTRLAARTRLRAYYQHALTSAVALLYPHRGLAQNGYFAEADDARDWLRAEWRNLIALAEDEPSDWAVEASRLLADYLNQRSLYDAAGELHQLARVSAVSARDRQGEGLALHNLALIDRTRGRFDSALDRHRQALAAFREIGDRPGEGRALHGIGTVLWRRGSYQQAYDALDAAVAIQRAVGDRAEEGTARYGLGIVSRRLGRYREAEQHHRTAIELLRAVADTAGEARALNNLGLVHMYLGRYGEALAEFRRSLVMHLALESRLGEAVVRDNLGSTYRRLGRHEEALIESRRALEIYLEIGYRAGEGDARRGIGATLGQLGEFDEAVRELCLAVDLGRALGELDITLGALADLGEVQLAAGNPDGAARSFDAALDVGEHSRDPYHGARALAGSAAAKHAAGDRAAARVRWQQALSLYEQMGLPEAADVRARLERSLP